jgi:predicted RNA binding protein YcfA (HicA-like mRNA interferase family)
MPKLPIVSGADAVRALERLGFVNTRRRGSHIVMRRGSSGCVVPNHRELKVGTLAGLLKQASVSPDEFIKALNPSSAL